MCRSINRAMAIALLLFTGTITGYSADAQIPGQPEGERYVLQTRVVRGDTGEPAAGVEVSWIGYRGGEQCLVSGADGTLEAPLSDAFGWVTLLYGRQGELVTQPLFLMSAASLSTDLILGPPASLMGTIQREDGDPLENCTVRLKADPRCVKAHFEARTDGNGEFLFEDLPPGQYYIQAGHDAYFAPPAWGTSLPTRVELVAGEISHHDFTLQEKSHLSGQILGPDGRGVASLRFHIPDDNDFDPKTVVTTDEAGNFQANVVPDSRGTRGTGIGSKTLGSGSFSIPATEPGEVVKDIVVQLHGVARVTGTVRGPNGEPVVGARVSNGRTDNDGHFDTGFVSLPKTGKLKVSVEAPIWQGSLSISRMNPVAPQLASDPVYYKNGAFTLAAKHGDVLTKDVVLKRIGIRTLRGRVLDVNGAPARNVTVAVYSGSAPARLWLEDLAPYTPLPPARVPQIPYQTMMSFPPAVILARISTDDEGRWEVRVLSENKNFNWIVAGDYVNLEELTLAAADATLEHTALNRVKTEVDSDSPIEVDLALEPITDDLVTYVQVIDDTGAPLPGVAWRLNSINGPFVSNQEGRVTLPRVADRLELRLMDASFQLLSAKASGDVVRPPQPKTDLESRNRSNFNSLEFTFSGPGIETTAPYIKTSEQTVT